MGSLVGGEVVEGHCEEGVERGPFKVEQGLCGPLAGYVASTQSSNNLTSGHVNSENRNRRMCTKRSTRVLRVGVSIWAEVTGNSLLLQTLDEHWTDCMEPCGQGDLGDSESRGHQLG